MKDVRVSLMAQIACADEVESNFVSLTKGEAKRILKLLKEQEAVEPDVDSEGTFLCGNCGTTVGYYPSGCSVPEKLCKYCPECGREVKWE